MPAKVHAIDRTIHDETIEDIDKLIDCSNNPVLQEDNDIDYLFYTWRFRSFLALSAQQSVSIHHKFYLGSLVSMTTVWHIVFHGGHKAAYTLLVSERCTPGALL